jgi:kynurenine formamidase
MGIKAIGFDFPQDYPIRLLLKGEEKRPFEEHVTHDILLRSGVTMIEYLCNTVALTANRTFLCALPLKVPAADGAPTRVIAIEQMPGQN